MTADVLDHRIVGALQAVDAVTRLPISSRIQARLRSAVRVDPGTRQPLDPLPGRPPVARVQRNSQGDVVLAELAVPGVAAYTAAFYDPPALPAVDAVFHLWDPSRLYLPRLFTLQLPRTVRPEDAALPTSIFTAAPALLYPSPAGRVELRWAVIRASVGLLVRPNPADRTQDRLGDRLPWALIRVLDNATGDERAVGLADGRGEAMIAVPNLPIVQPASGGGAVVTSGLEVRLEVHFDRDHVKRLTQADMRAGRDPNRDPGPDRSKDYVPDPDALAALPALPGEIKQPNTATAAALRLVSGRTLGADVLVTLP